MSKKKLVHIIQALKIGGAEMLLAELAKSCVSEYDVYIIALYKENNIFLDETLQSAGVSIIYLDKKVGLHLKSIRALWQLLTKIKPDIIHTHLEAAVYAIPYLIFNRKNIRVHTIHTRPKYEFTKYHIAVMRFAYRYLKVIPVAISPSIQAEAASLYSIDSSKIPVIFNGVHTDKYACNRESELREIRIINVSSFSEVKNHKLLINAFKLINEANKKISLTLVGDGRLRKSTKLLALEYGFQDDLISFLGNRNDVNSLLAKSDIFVLCSLYEGVPLSILEAYASGLPVVATNVGGVPDILTNMENGILVPSNDVTALANAVLELAANIDLYKTISKNNKEKAREFDISIIAAQYKTLYERDI